MTSTSATSAPLASLSDDIQRALQQAVGDANNAANAAAVQAKAKKSKRQRDEAGDGTVAEDAGNVRKKKKSKHRDASASASAEQAGASTSESPSGSSNERTPGAVSGAGAGVSNDTPGASPDITATAPSKKKKKGKGKERAHEDQSQSQPISLLSAPDALAPAQVVPTQGEIPQAVIQQPVPTTSSSGVPMDLATSSADFISAVVAAASATAGQQPQGGQSLDQAMQQYMAYPPPEFDPYAYAGPPPGHPPHPPSGLPPAHGQPHHPFPAPFPDMTGILPDLNFASSEDLLRSLQEFDISKVVTVLKTLGEAAAAANIHLNGPPMFVPVPQQPPPPTVQQQPVRSEAILGRPPKQKKGRGQGANGAGGTGEAAPPQPDNPDHAHMLANVWMNASKLAEMVRTEGLVYKKGKFSATEEAQLAAAIERYRVKKGLSQAELDQIVFSNKVGREKGHESFWSEITSALQLRPIIAVYHHVRRTRHPYAGKGTWTKTEDELLIQSVQDLGQQWEKISDIVQRTAADCRDRYRNHLQDRDVRRSGTWSKEEEEELTRIVTEMTVGQGKDMDNDIFWGVVSQKMGGTRGRQQCRIKWTDSLAPQLKNTGERPRWSAMDAYILVHKVDSMNVRDDTEIDWKLLPDENWNVWSAHSLQRRWLTMKRSIKGFEEMSHAEIMEILKTKKAQSPPPSSISRKKKSKFTSAEAVNDVDDVEMEGQPEAGSSSGPGTFVGAAGLD
ncbi:hypothetical protein BD311DRAFT_473065 [Dichomitus squalens]|uniref:Uncharacterized protein n=2 Tax=Dichomitus squalens TaxID=114155 RepID=A0A4Q9N1I3_9APHY|nr:hypothetical protein BD311DRAFT_473065 [Dichomitus squalens]